MNLKNNPIMEDAELYIVIFKHPISKMVLETDPVPFMEAVQLFHLYLANKAGGVTIKSISK